MIVCGVTACGVVGIWCKREDVEGQKMYEYSKSAVLSDRERSEAFDVEQGVAQGSPILFSVFINGLLRLGSI